MGAPSRLRSTRKAAALARVLPTFVRSCAENASRRKWKSPLFPTPHKDALVLGIKTVMNIRGVGGDVAKIKSPLVYTFLDNKGEYVGFHYQSLYLLESLPIPLLATTDQRSSRCGRSCWAPARPVLSQVRVGSYQYSNAQQQDFIRCPKD
jgi:hypothetical protein